MNNFDDKPIVNMSGTIPQPLQDTRCICGLRAKRGGRTWHRQFFLTEEGEGYIVYDWTWHDMMPDCRIGWLDGVFTLEELEHKHPEFMPAYEREMASYHDGW